jgi:hypothetical protein
LKELLDFSSLNLEGLWIVGVFWLQETRRILAQIPLECSDVHDQRHLALLRDLKEARSQSL